MEIVIIEGINNDLNTWEIKKNEFENCKTYSEKLKWWDDNIFHGGNFSYSSPLQVLGPTNGNLIAMEIVNVGDYDGEICETHHERLMYGFMSILPSFIEGEKTAFWNWILEKSQIGGYSKYLEYYQNKFSHVHPANFTEAKMNCEKEIALQLEINSKNQFFQMGRNYAIFKDAEILELGYSIYYYYFLERIIFSTLYGYKNNLQEVALLDVIKEYERNLQEMDSKHNKIKWLGTPSQFSFLFLELANKGFIEFPIYNGEISPTRLAKLCFNNFEIETTEGSLTTEFKTNSSLSETYRAKFTIPEKKDITDKRSGNNKKQ